MQIRIDEELVYEKTNIQTIYENLDNGGKIKLGMYYWKWKNKENVQAALDEGVTQRVLYIDEYREYKGPEGYDKVRPAI